MFAEITIAALLMAEPAHIPVQIQTEYGTVYESVQSPIDLATAKSAGWVGERRDGLVGIAEDDIPENIMILRALVQSVNLMRLERYREIALEHGMPVEEVQERAGDSLIHLSPAGHIVQDAHGQWIRKEERE